VHPCLRVASRRRRVMSAPQWHGTNTFGHDKTSVYHLNIV
jgi:hypothetical protein